MAYKNLTSAILAVVFLFLCCGTFLFGVVASQDAELLSGEQQASAQNYRPYYNYNQRPGYPVRRPAYNNYANQRPQIPVAAPSSTNYRPAPAPAPVPAPAPAVPAPAPAPTTARPSTTISGSSCGSSNSYQQYGICWAPEGQRLQISPNLTIENFVRFHKMNFDGPLVYTTSYRRQLCEQSRRFNSVGILCTSTSDSSGHEECFYKRAGGISTSAAKSCINYDCICVVGDPYESIATNTNSPNSPFSAPVFQPGYWEAFNAQLNQNLQTHLAANGINWKPLQLPSSFSSLISPNFTGK